MGDIVYRTATSEYAEQMVELAPHRRERTGLDLDQQVAAHDVDDELADGRLDLVTGPSQPLLEPGVQRPLVERADVGGRGFGGSARWRRCGCDGSTLTPGPPPVV